MAPRATNCSSSTISVGGKHGGDAGVLAGQQADPGVAVLGGEGGPEVGPHLVLDLVVELVVDPLLATEEPAQVGEEPVLDGPDGQPSAVGRRVAVVAGIATRDDVVTVPDAGPGGQVLVDGQRHEPQHAVGHGHVEVGAGPVPSATDEGGHDGHGRVHAPGGGVGDGGPGDGRPAVGPRLAGSQVATHGQVVDVVAGPAGPRAVWPKPVVEHSTMPGLTADRRSKPRPSRSSTPGRKLSTTTSAVGHQGTEGLAPAVVLEVDAQVPEPPPPL